MKYLSHAAADSMKTWMRDRKRDISKRERARLMVYRCRRCGFWHVGMTPPLAEGA